MRKAMRIVALFAAVVTATTASAQIDSIGQWLYNFNVPNNTGQYANNFEVTLCGVTSNQIAGLFTNNCTNYSITENSSNCSVITWYGSYPPDSSPHFGVTLTNYNNVTSLALNWTSNNTAVGSVSCVRGHHGVYDNTDGVYISNADPNNALWISVALVGMPDPVQLTDLTTNGPEWANAATNFVPAIRLAAGASNTYYLTDVGTVQSWGLVIQQFSDTTNDGTNVPGQLQMIHFSFVNLTNAVTSPVSAPGTPPGSPPAAYSTFPTLSQWGLIILGLGLLATGSLYIRKRMASAQV
jgi:hypothetical protein